MSATAAASSRTIFIIRHGEKPETPPPWGVEPLGAIDRHSLLVRGWQRAGALATLFAPYREALRPGLLRPDQLLSPTYGEPTTTAEHRTFQTILPLSQLTGVGIMSPFAEGEEAMLGTWLGETTSGVTLVCWEHTRIHTIGEAIPTQPGTKIPGTWPEERFDIVWSFVREPASGRYTFEQIPQMLLAEDREAPIPPAPQPA
jgi:hypothetical protein